jgi:hypothetical protein
MMRRCIAADINEMVCWIVSMGGNADFHLREDEVKKRGMVPIDTAILGGDKKDSM